MYVVMKFFFLKVCILTVFVFQVLFVQDTLFSKLAIPK